MKQITAYQCGFCAKCYARPQSTATHERSCRNNPARKHCKTCKHGREEAVPCGYPSPDDYYQEAEMWVPWCDIHNKAIHEKPYSIDCDMERGGYGEEDYPLPGTCHHYEYKGYAGWREPVPAAKEAT